MDFIDFKSGVFKNLPEGVDDVRLEKINEMLIKLASHDFDLDVDISTGRDLIDAVAIGIKLLGDELESSTISHDYLNSIYRGVADMLFILNPDHSIRSVNDPVTKLLGYSIQNLRDVKFASLVNDIEKEYIDQVHHELYASGFCYDIELYLKSKSGELVPTLCSSSLLHNSKGEVSGVLYIAKDNSKIKKKEQEIISKDRELDAFIFKASHDINGPLSTVLGLTQLALKEAKEDNIIEYLKMIQTTLEKLDLTMIDLVELSRMNNLEQKVSLVSYKEMINEIVNRLYVTIARPDDIRIDFNTDHSCTFFSVERLVYSVFQNIIENAFKYRNVSKTVESFLKIHIEVTEQNLIVDFEDNGVGVSKETLPFIYRMFELGDGSLKGAGLGLFVVKTNIEKLKGEIEFSSREGVGTRIKVTIPNSLSQNSVPEGW